MHNKNGGIMKKLYMLLTILLVLFPLNVLAIAEYVIPGGENIGIKIESNGVLVVGFYKINNRYNYNNLNIGDYITKVNDQEVNSVNELVNILDTYKQDDYIKLEIRRNGKIKNINFSIINVGGTIKTGLYVKDSLSGIGTLTYIDPTTNTYGALGHEIIESETNTKLEISNGNIFRSEVTSIDRSTNGNPGTKNAKLYYKDIYGTIIKNTNKGIYGTIDTYETKDALKVGQADELKLGYATIYTVIEDNTIGEYSINITKIDKKSSTKNIYFEITDERLLEVTGGIVQGMSGSPIIQDNKVFGAVTHVVVDNVKNGYGIFITTMLEEGEK